MHEITPFQWDKVYFFAYDSGDKNYIAKVTGMQGDFRQGRETSLLFIKDGKLVKYEKFIVIQDYDKPVFSWSLPYINVYISFITGKYRLKELNYSGNSDDFLDDSKGYIGINYYELTPQNDQLYAGCGMRDINQISFKQCALSFTNLDQVKLFNPQMDNN